MYTRARIPSKTYIAGLWSLGNPTISKNILGTTHYEASLLSFHFSRYSWRCMEYPYACAAWLFCSKNTTAEISLSLSHPSYKLRWFLRIYGYSQLMFFLFIVKLDFEYFIPYSWNSSHIAKQTSHNVQEWSMWWKIPTWQACCGRHSGYRGINCTCLSIYELVHYLEGHVY